MKKAAIIILNFNGETMLRRFLPSVLEHAVFDCWVIDNQSTDRSRQVLEEEFGTVQRIYLSQNKGYAGGYNAGLEELKDKYTYYILLNSDVEVRAHWDRILIERLESNPHWAAIQPKILSAIHRDRFDYAGGGGGFLDALYYPYCRGRIWDHLEIDSGQYDADCLVDWTSGACFAIRSACFHGMGGFDSRFFAHMEEIDLCLRLTRAGYLLAYTGESTVYHLGGGTLHRDSPRKLQLNIRNSLSMIYKNESRGQFWLIFLQKVLLEAGAGFGYVLRGKFEAARAIWDGYREFFGERKHYEPIKKPSNRKSLGPSRYVFVDYFFRKRKKFSQL